MERDNLENNQFFLISEMEHLKNLVNKYPNDYDLGNAVRKHFNTRKKIVNK